MFNSYLILISHSAAGVIVRMVVVHFFPSYEAISVSLFKNDYLIDKPGMDCVV